MQGTWAVLQAAEDCGVRRVVVASSDAALGLHYNPPGWGPQYLPIDEDHPLRPIDFYSLSKECTESICRSYANRGKVEVIAIRARLTSSFRRNIRSSRRAAPTFRTIICGPMSRPKTSLRAFAARSIRPTAVTAAYFITAKRRAQHAPDAGASARALRRAAACPRRRLFREEPDAPPFSTAGEPATASVSRPRSTGAIWSPSAMRPRGKPDEPQRAVLWLQHLFLHDRYTAEDCLRRLADLGFSEFELMMYPGHLWPPDANAAQRAALRRLIASAIFASSR